MSQLIINAVTRSEAGKGASRRLRRQDKLPAIVYGAEKDPISVILEGNQIRKAQQQESFYSQMLNLAIAEVGEETVIVKSLQRHPVSEVVTHIDFQRVDPNRAITTSVPLHFTNENTAPGIKAGGAMAKFTTSVVVRCLPGILPEYIAVDMGNMEIGETIHLSELVLPEGVESMERVRGHNQGIVSLLATRSSRSSDDEEGEEGSGDSA